MIIRNIALLSLRLCGGIVLLSCVDDSLSPLPAEPDAAASCPLSGSVLRLGSDDGFATPEERPGWTRLRHDVRMDRTEMTQAEYAALLRRNPSTIRGDSLPVTDVSWYDAALAANARSRRDGLDTVYEYASVSGDAQGNASNLEGLTVHLDRSGWRLPTEAEWEAAARAGTSTPWAWGGLSDSDKAATCAWYQKNAVGRTHSVGTKSPNAWGLYDMAGNVMEWVNDWKGAFPKDTVEDFAGQESPGDVAEVPLKGGSYNYGLLQLRPSSRTATYAAYRSSRAEYVGFRLCRGGFTARYSNSSGVVVQAPPVTLVRSDLARFMGTWSARLVFVNRANGKGVLTWIDYGETNPVARSLPDKDPVFHPSISPDGRWVAWSTVLEGSAGASRIKARRLAKNDTTVLDLGAGAIPRWWVSGTDTFLIAGDARDNLASGWSAAKTMAWHWSNGAVSDPATWSSEGSYHDGRSGLYLYTGYRRLRQHDVRSGTSRILFTAPQNGKSDGDTSQVCNVSAAPDSSGRVMFLDFGYPQASQVVGRSYGIHEIAFVSDSTGRVVKTIPSPAGEVQWEHMEWSNSPKWAASGAIDGTGAYRNLYLVDLENATSTKVVSGEQLWQPNLWVGSASIAVDSGGADPDSAGAYDAKIDPAVISVLGDGGFSEYAAKLSNFWEIKDSVEMVFIGSSRVKMGFSPTVFKSMRSFNFGYSGSELYDEELTIRKYILPQASKLKYLCIGLMPGWFVEYDGRNSGYLLWQSIENSIGYRYDKNHSFWSDSMPKGFLPAVRNNRSSLGGFYHPYGEIQVPSGQWGSSPDLSGTNALVNLQSPGYANNLLRLENIVNDLAKSNIRVLLVNFPVNPGYKSTPFADLFGPTWDVNDSLISKLRALELRHGNYKFYDANRRGEHDYLPEDAYDDGHLSYLGAKKLTVRLDSVLSEWAKE